MLNERIQGLSRAFVDDVTALLRDCVLDALGRGKPYFRVPVSAVAQAPRSNKLAKGEKRSPLAIRIATDRLFAMIELRPGHRIEQLAEMMACETSELRLPVKKLIAADRVFVKGEKRATRYYPVQAAS